MQKVGTNSIKYIEYVNKSITGEDSIKMNEEQKEIFTDWLLNDNREACNV